MSANTDIADKRALVDKLLRLGLTEKQARVYLALLPHRDIGTSKLIRMTGLHGQFVYDALRQLEKLNLVTHVIQSGRKKFSAGPPLRLLSLVEEKRLDAQSVARELQSRYSGAHQQNFEIFQGENALIAHELETFRTMEKNTRIDVIGGGKDRYWTIFQEAGYSEEREDIRKKRNITIRYLGAERPLQDLNQMKREMWGWEYRTLRGLSTGVVDTDIWYDQVHFNIFGDPVLSFCIVGKEIADGYREFFETLWKMAK